MRRMGRAAAGRGGHPRCSDCRSAEKVAGQSAGGRNRVAHRASSTAATSATTMATATSGRLAMASVQELVGSDAEDRLLHEVGEVQLRDVDPPLLRKLDEDPDEGGDADDRPHGEPKVAARDLEGLDGVEEVLERVRKDEEHPSAPVLLEQRDADEAVVPEKPPDDEGRARCTQFAMVET